MLKHFPEKLKHRMRKEFTSVSYVLLTSKPKLCKKVHLAVPNLGRRRF